MTAAGRATGLYAHIPFCAVKCRFCDFAAYPGRRGDSARYLEVLAAECRRRSRDWPGRFLDSLYVGGGSPSLLEPEEWKAVVLAAERAFPFGSGMEFTVESNPEEATGGRLAAWRASGVNRLSLGAQTDDPDLLRVLGRRHGGADISGSLRRARAEGFDNVNLDLIYGLPGQDLAGWLETLRRMLDLGPDHLSAYALSVEERTDFHRRGFDPDPDLQADMYEAASDLLQEAGFLHYEISNFARPGRECRHNLRYWRNQECLGVGASAAWYAGGTRRANARDLTDYMEAVESGRDPVVESIHLSGAEREGEDLMLGLRLAEGVRGAPAYAPVLERYRQLGCLTETTGFFRPTRRGWRLSNRLFQELLGPSA